MLLGVEFARQEQMDIVAFLECKSGADDATSVLDSHNTRAAEAGDKQPYHLYHHNN